MNNNTNVCPIIYSNRDNINNTLKNSISYYQEETTEHIKTCLPVYLRNKKNTDKKVKNIIRYILTNDDLFNHMMTAVMLADFTHNKNRGSLKYWRSKYCIWTFNKNTYKNKKRLQNLGDNLSTNDSILNDLIEKESHVLLCNKIDGLDKRSKEICKLYYLDNISEKNIARMFTLSQQRVSQILLNAKKELNNV